MKRHDEVWRDLVTLVTNHLDAWRRQVVLEIGMPFSRYRALKRLADGPRSLGELAEAMASDAPAATVAVNDLEKRGLVSRTAHPDDRRVKLVALTAAGRRMLSRARRVHDPAPREIAALSSAELAVLSGLLRKQATGGRSRRKRASSTD